MSTQKKNLLILVGILVIVAMIVIIFSIKDLSKEDKVEEKPTLTEEELKQVGKMIMTKEELENINIYEGLDIVVENLYDFVKVYQGDLKTSDYTNYIRDLNTNFATLYSEVSKATDTKKYFDDNSKEISKKYGITEYNDFEDLVKYIEIYKTSGLTYKTVSLKKDTVKDLEDYVQTTVNITYSNDVTKTINISVLKDTATDSPEFVVSF